MKQVFTGPGMGLLAILAGVLGERRRVRTLLSSAGVPPGSLPRDITPAQWARLWQDVRIKEHSPSGRRVSP